MINLLCTLWQKHTKQEYIILPFLNFFLLFPNLKYYVLTLGFTKFYKNIKDKKKKKKMRHCEQIIKKESRKINQFNLKSRITNNSKSILICEIANLFY